MFDKVDQKVSFPDMEKQLMARWKEENAFQRSLDLRAGRQVKHGPSGQALDRAFARVRRGGVRRLLGVSQMSVHQCRKRGEQSKSLHPSGHDSYQRSIATGVQSYSSELWR